MVQSELFISEDKQGEDAENEYRDNFLDNLQFYKREGTTGFSETYTVGRNLESVFKECNTPAEYDYSQEAQTLEPAHCFKLQMTIPCHSHESI